MAVVIHIIFSKVCRSLTTEIFDRQISLIASIQTTETLFNFPNIRTNIWIGMFSGALKELGIFIRREPSIPLHIVDQIGRK